MLYFQSYSFLFSLKEEIRKENNSSVDLIRLVLHCSLVFPPVTAPVCSPAQKWTTALDESPTQRQYSYLSTLSCIKWMIMSFHRMKAQAEPPHWEESDFKQSWRHILYYSGSSNVPIAVYMSAFRANPAPTYRSSLSTSSATGCACNKCRGIRRCLLGCGDRRKYWVTIWKWQNLQRS